MILRSLYLVASLISCAVADVKFTTPAAGATVAGGSTISVAWKDSGTAPALTALTSYQLFLCAGSNDATGQIQLATLVANGDFSDGNTASATVDAGLAGSSTNAYFLKMISVASAGGTVINYSSRFSLSGMTGTFPANVQSALGDISGTAGPATENNVVASNQNPQANDNTAVATGAATGSYALAYTMQTGAVRYAPMPPLAVTKITANQASMQYPTSAFTIASTYLPIPVAATTQTQSQTFSTMSMENTASAAPMPTDTAMARFLQRWKD